MLMSNSLQNFISIWYWEASISLASSTQGSSLREEQCCTTLCNAISFWCGQRNAIKSQICFDVCVSTTQSLLKCGQLKHLVQLENMPNNYNLSLNILLSNSNNHFDCWLVDNPNQNIFAENLSLGNDFRVSSASNP